MKRILYLFLILFLWGCAIQVAPSGGLLDELPPEILGEKPPSETTNFDSDEIEISFDEFVRLDRLKDQLVVSPPLEYNLSNKIRGKRLILGIKDTLKPSTTYVFNFGNAIVDIHENNPIENYSYVLSTGSSLDSGKIEGKVMKAFEAEPASKVYVMAYSTDRENLDSLPYLEKPEYLAQTNEAGYFSLKYMKEGDYRLFALLDDNSNYLFDKPTENIGFVDSIVNSHSGIDSLEIRLFEEDNEKQYVKEQEEDGPSTRLIFNLEVDSFSYSTELVDSIDLEVLLEDYQAPNDSFMLWWPNMKLRFPLIVNADTLTDTLKVAIDTIPQKQKLRVKSFGQHRYYHFPTMKFSYPLETIDTSKLKLFNEDSVEIPFELEARQNSLEYIFKYEMEQKAKYDLSIDSAAFFDIYGNTNDSLGYSFSLDEESDYGSLKIDLEIEYDGPLILQLTTAQYKPVREVKLSERTYLFEHLKSGSFSLKLFLDANGNGKWDTGNYLEGIQPEKVINYQGEIRIRERWAKEVDWVITD